jgi:hypothetical protein
VVVKSNRICDFHPAKTHVGLQRPKLFRPLSLKLSFLVVIGSFKVIFLAFQKGSRHVTTHHQFKSHILPVDISMVLHPFGGSAIPVAQNFYFQAT